MSGDVLLQSQLTFQFPSSQHGDQMTNGSCVRTCAICVPSMTAVVLIASIVFHRLDCGSSSKSPYPHPALSIL